MSIFRDFLEREMVCVCVCVCVVRAFFFVGCALVLCDVFIVCACLDARSCSPVCVCVCDRCIFPVICTLCIFPVICTLCIFPVICTLCNTVEIKPHNEQRLRYSTLCSLSRAIWITCSQTARADSSCMLNTTHALAHPPVVLARSPSCSSCSDLMQLDPQLWVNCGRIRVFFSMLVSSLATVKNLSSKLRVRSFPCVRVCVRVFS
jgi:hypothetical protein